MICMSSRAICSIYFLITGLVNVLGSLMENNYLVKINRLNLQEYLLINANF